MEQKKIIVSIFAVSSVMLGGLVYFLWTQYKDVQATEGLRPSLSLTTQSSGTSTEPGSGAIDPETRFQDSSLPVLEKEIARFSTNAGVEVLLMSYADCSECEAPEFLGVQTDADSKLNSVPAPQLNNVSDTIGSKIRAAIIYGKCANEVEVYHEVTTSLDEGESNKKYSFNKWIASISEQGEITITTVPLTREIFEKKWQEKAPQGCTVLQQQGDLAGG